MIAIISFEMILNYFGSKARILPTLKSIINPLISKCLANKHLNDRVVFGDLFAGTGVVGASYLYDKRIGTIISNDVEVYSYVINKALLQLKYSAKIAKIIACLNGPYLQCIHSGLITRNFSPHAPCKRMFFTIPTAQRIDAIRKALHVLYCKGLVSYDEFVFLLASLFVSVSKYSNTAASFRAYLKTFSKRSERPFKLTPIHQNYSYQQSSLSEFKKTKVSKKDIVHAVKRAPQMDIVYLDPPYNSSHYGSCYGFYNYLAYYRQDYQLDGVAGIMHNYYKSEFGLRLYAKNAFCKLFQALKDNGTKYVVLSYNDNAVLGKNEMSDIMRKFGSVTVHKLWNKKYKSHNLVKSNLVKELIFVIDLKHEHRHLKENWI